MKLRLRLHKPQEIIWVVAILLTILGIVGYLMPGMLPAVDAFWLVLVAAALMVLGTWVF